MYLGTINSKTSLRCIEFQVMRIFIDTCNVYLGIIVKKLKCVGHPQKRTGYQLNLKKNKNEKVPGGKGKLTNKMTDRLQNYHGLAIQQNKNNLKGIQSKLKLVYFMQHHQVRITYIAHIVLKVAIVSENLIRKRPTKIQHTNPGLGYLYLLG